jgi:hypothetical protein
MAQNLAAAALALFATLAPAGERQELEALRATTLNLIRLLVTEGILTQEKANALIRQAQAAAQAAAGKPGPAVRVPYVPQVVREQLKDELREEVIAQAKAERWADPGRLPAWADRLVLEGDVRLRLQRDFLDRDNAPAAFFQALGQNINNTTEDRTRLRLRARLGLRASIAEGVQAGLAFATGTVGSTGSPNSTNNTLGDYFNRQSAGIDLAYVRWQPHEVLTLQGGRIENPFFGTDLLWAPDLRFDGVAASLRPFLREDVKPFLSLGAFPLREFEPIPESNPSRRNKWLYATQVGVDFGAPDATLLRLGAAYYSYRNVAGIPNVGAAGTPGATLQDWTAPQFRQKGNTLFPISVAGTPLANVLYGLASQFRIVNLTGELGLRYDEFKRFSVTADWAKNAGFDRAEILSRAGGTLEPRTFAFHARASFGHRLIERWGDWSVFGGYKRIERDAVLDAFNDGDFNLGGTNAKGWYLGGTYGVGRNAWFAFKYTTANQVDGPPLAIDVLQLDFNARF